MSVLKNNLLLATKESFDLIMVNSSSEDEVDRFSALNYYRDLCALTDLTHYEEPGLSAQAVETLSGYHDKATQVFVNMPRPAETK